MYFNIYIWLFVSSFSVVSAFQKFPIQYNYLTTWLCLILWQREMTSDFISHQGDLPSFTIRLGSELYTVCGAGQYEHKTVDWNPSGETFPIFSLGKYIRLFCQLGAMTMTWCYRLGRYICNIPQHFRKCIVIVYTSFSTLSSTFVFSLSPCGSLIFLCAESSRINSGYTPDRSRSQMYKFRPILRYLQARARTCCSEIFLWSVAFACSDSNRTVRFGHVSIACPLPRRFFRNLSSTLAGLERCYRGQIFSCPVKPFCVCFVFVNSSIQRVTRRKSLATTGVS